MDLVVKTVWPNSFAKLVRNSIKVAQLRCFSVQICTKKLAVSWNMFSLSSQELISRSDSWKAPKFGPIPHHYLVSKVVLLIFDIRSPSHFLLMPILQKVARFCKHELLRAISIKAKSQNSPAPFCKTRLPRPISKKETRLWCSLIEIDSSADTVL